MDDNPVIGFAGMTHLGLNSAVAATIRGFQIICYDEDTALLAALRAGQPPIIEPDLSETMLKNNDLLSFEDSESSLAACDVVYIAPDVPTDDAGGSDLSPVKKLIKIADRAMRPDAVLVVLSQVSPGFMRELNLARRHVYYQVETLIFGQAIHRARHPERYIVGCANPGEPLPGPYRRFLEAHDCPILPMRYESAELAKISINCCLVASVGVANTLADLCERVGAHWSEIVPALKLDRRIGEFSYINPGLGIAGGNLERDLATVRRLGDEHGSDTGIVSAWLANSAYRKEWVLRVLHEEVISRIDDPKISVLGLSYKQDTHSTKNSPALALLRTLTPFRVRAYDPVVEPSIEFHPGLEPESDALTICEGADAVAIMTPWAEFKEISPANLAERMGGGLVIDPYSVLKADLCRAAGLRYRTLGAPNNDQIEIAAC